VAAFKDLIEQGLSLGDVEAILSTTKQLECQKVDAGEFISIVAVLAAASVDPNVVLQWRNQMMQSGLTFAQLKQALEFSSQLAALGFTTATLPAVVKLAGNFGDANKVLEAVATYGSLNNINAEIDTTGENLKKIETEVASASVKLQATTAKVSEQAEELEALAKVRKLGYSQNVLTEMTTLTAKQGGVKSVFKALNIGGIGGFGWVILLHFQELAQRLVVHIGKDPNCAHHTDCAFQQQPGFHG
jgi:hypothetical protein